jgi:hypothetical protein
MLKNMNKKIYKLLTLLLCSACLVTELKAQFTLSGQIRTRSEYRDGQGTLSKQDTAAAFFTSQRTRVNLGYAGHRFKIYTSIQDVRVWGQDASSINRNTLDAFDGLMLHEAWGEISLVDTGKVVKNFTVKIGRQELVYDDVRLLGNLDWLQQARRHDAIVFKLDHNGWTAHLGGAFNQNAERKSNIIYNGVTTAYPSSTNALGAQYKSMQFLYLAKKVHFGNVSFLAFKDDFSKFSIVNNATVYGQSVWSRYTLGFYTAGTAMRKLAFTASAYYQGGKFREGTSLDEYLLHAAGLYAAGRKVSFGPGIDYTSGNNGSDPAKKFQRFDPLYGTPHKFWGYMDYFYVADAFGPSGLVDAYFKVKYKAKDNLNLSLDIHQFALPNAVNDESGVALEKKLGNEIDFVFNFALTKAINIEGGYCTMLATETMASSMVKKVANADKTANWAYLMINIKPADFVIKN